MIKRTKKFACLLLAAVMIFLVSCSGGEAKSDKIEILCTIYPQYDWVKNIVGECDNVEVRLLVGSGADVHSYQPSVEDVVNIKRSDAVILIGGEADAWVFETLEGSQSEIIALMELEGMILHGVSDECIAEEHDHEHDHYHDNVVDEHVWLSVANARTACRAICEWLCDADSENAELYRENTKKYVSELDALDKSFEELAEGAREPVIFADRFPFVYLFEDYGISYFAAFAGCSADTEADFDTVMRLAKKLGEYENEYIAVCESSDKRLAESVMGAAGTECGIVVFDSMQSVTERQVEDGYNYIDAMRTNLDALAKLIK